MCVAKYYGNVTFVRACMYPSATVEPLEYEPRGLATLLHEVLYKYRLIPYLRRKLSPSHDV